MSTVTLPARGANAEEARPKDYSLVGRDTALAIDRGLAEIARGVGEVDAAVLCDMLHSTAYSTLLLIPPLNAHRYHGGILM